MNNLTRRAAWQIVVKRRRSGWFRGNPAWLNCPLCTQRITTQQTWGGDVATFTALESELFHHLLDRYDDIRCPAVESVRKGSEL